MSAPTARRAARRGAAAPDWTRHVIWWQVFPLGFVGAEPELTEEPGRSRTGCAG